MPKNNMDISHELHVYDWADLRSDIVKCPVIWSPSIRSISDAFDVNISRFLFIQDLFSYAYLIGANDSAYKIDALFIAYGTPLARKIDYSDQIKRKEFNKAIARLKRELISPIDGHVLRMGGTNLSGIAPLMRHHSATLESIMAMQVVAMWTAFETLAGDLWEAILNQFPDTAINDSQVGTSKDRELPLWVLKKYGYDLRSKMGSILRGRTNFTKLENIKGNYKRAFEASGQLIYKTITDPCFDDLSALRNVLVHKSGIVDSEFYKRNCRKMYFPASQIGQRVPMDGKIARKLLIACINQCQQLLIEADQWMQSRDS